MKVTVPKALGGDTAKRMPAQAVPARPVAMGSMLKMGWAGKARGSGAVHGSTSGTVPAVLVAFTHDGFSRMFVRAIVSLATVPSDWLVMAMRPDTFWSPTVTAAGKAGATERAMAFTCDSAGLGPTVREATTRVRTIATRAHRAGARPPARRTTSCLTHQCRSPDLDMQAERWREGPGGRPDTKGGRRGRPDLRLRSANLLLPPCFRLRPPMSPTF